MQSESHHPVREKSIENSLTETQVAIVVSFHLWEIGEDWMQAVAHEIWSVVIKTTDEYQGNIQYVSEYVHDLLYKQLSDHSIEFVTL